MNEKSIKTLGLKCVICDRPAEYIVWGYSVCGECVKKQYEVSLKRVGRLEEELEKWREELEELKRKWRVKL